MSIAMSILALLEDGASYGLQLRNEFESRTGSILPLNVGQVYTTLNRLERDGLVISQESLGAEKLYKITAAGRRTLKEWFLKPSLRGAPDRDELVLKLVMAVAQHRVEVTAVIQAERRAAVELLQEYTRLKRAADDGTDIGWVFLLDSLIFQTEARVRWLDACEARLHKTASDAPTRVRAEPRERVPR